VSQAGSVDLQNSNPQVPTQFDTDSGSAVPIANTLEIIGGAGVTTSGSGNTVTISLTGGGAAIDSITVDAFIGPGTNPVSPDNLGLITVTGAQVADGVIGANVIRSNSLAANSYTMEIQQAGSALVAMTAKNGVSHFKSTDFTIANGFVSLAFGHPSFTTGSVIFWEGTNFAEDNANFFWDNVNNRLGIGISSPLDTLHVVGAMELDHTATKNDDHAIDLVVNANGFSDVKGIDIDYITGTMGASQDEEAILVNIDETASTGGIIAGYLVLTTAKGSATVNGYETGINVNPIVQESGTFGNADNILNKAVDVTAALASGGAGAISAFVADNDTFTIGDAAKFGELEIILTTPSSGAGIAPTFEYSIGAATFVSFVPADGTNGFRNTGAILWDASTLVGWVVAASGRYEIRITRTRNTLLTTPVIDEIQISTLIEFKWDKNGDVNINSLTLVVPLTVPNGGTGNATLTDHGIMLGSGSGAVTVTASPTNGQLLIGSTGVDPVLATLTSGTGIIITNAAGSITIAVSSGGFTWSDTSGAFSPLAQNGYFITGTATGTLPSAPANGDTIQFFVDHASQVLTIQATAGKIIRFGSTVSAEAGTAVSTLQGDSVELVYRSTNTCWCAVSGFTGVWNVT